MQKKRWIWLILLLVFTFLGDRLGGWVLGKIRDRSQFRYSRLYTGKGQADILLVGNSRGLPLFQPYVEEATGRSTLNLSYNGLPNYLGVAFVLDYLDRYPAPDQIVYDITICNGGNPPLTIGMGPYSDYSFRVDSLIKEVSDQDTTGHFDFAYKGQKFSHLYRYDSEVFLQMPYYLTKSDKYWLMDREIPKAMVDEMSDFKPLPFDIWPSMLTDLRQMVIKAKAKGSEVKFIVGPYYPGYADKLPNLDELIQKVEKTTGLPVADFSRGLSNGAYFADYQHPNLKGSKAYIDLLVEVGVFE
ncbi:MAG TPA: hypothetical protein ENK85_12285 [Saprospiraceae bacterium]|nr:hypothetical protein [Saprospiraceae bacterium]